MKKTVIHIIESTATGTLEITRLMTQCLEQLNYKNIVLFSRRAETPNDVETIFSENTTVIEVEMKSTHSLKALTKIRSIAYHYKPTHIHMHSSVAGFLGRIALFKSINTKLIYSPHCISFLRMDITPYKKLAFIILERLANLNSATYLACSESEKQQIQAHIPGATVIALENAINTKELPNKENSTASNNKMKTIVTSGGIRTQKNPNEFAYIARELKSREYQFIWIGDGDQELRANLEKSGVFVTGWLPRTDTLHYLSKSDIYLSTARWEGMPVSVIEAACIGLRLVLSKIDGHTDIAEDSYYCTHFRTPDEAIESILNPDKTAPSNEDRNKILDRFSHKAFYNKLRTVYKDS